MKVILLKDVKNYGIKNQIVEVSDGYARNYLFPNNLAVSASKDSISRLNNKIKKEQQIDEVKKVQLELFKQEIENLNIKFKLKVKNDKSFGVISLSQICDIIKKEYNLEIDKRKFEKHNNLNKLGIHYLKIKLSTSVIATLKVDVEGS